MPASSPDAISAQPRRRRLSTLALIASLASVFALVLPASASAVDNVDVTVTLMTYQEIHCPDGELVPCPGDYYGKISIGPFDFESTPKGPVDTATHSPNWRVTKTLDRDRSRFWNIAIELWDDDLDDGNPDDQIDVSPGTDTLRLILDLQTGNWIGDSTPNRGWAQGSNDPAARILFDISLSSTGDTDADGIPDGVERFGVRDVANGNVVADLTNFGSINPQAADPCRKTVLMEVDFMNGAGDGHTHRPQDAALTELQNAFASAPPPATAPCPYAGGGFGTTNGVQLLIDRGNAIGEQPVFNLNDLVATRNDAANFHPARRPFFHYAVFAHDQAAGSSSSGLCCRDGKDFIVTLGSWRRLCVGAGPNGAGNTVAVGDDQADGNGNITNGVDRTCNTTANSGAPAGAPPGDDVQLLAVGDNTSDQAGTPRDQSSTIMHELGHSLGLEHRGRDDINNTPNYLSVMNYLFQPGIPLVAGGSALDYSRTALATINERALNENAGIGGPAQFNTFWFDPTGTQRTARAAGQLYPDGRTGIDWDRDNTVEGSVDVDLNVDSLCIGPGGDTTIDTTRLNDDGLANNFINNGPDETCDTITPAGNDIQMGSGTGPSGADMNVSCVGPGPNEKIDTAKVGDDIRFTNAINSGPNLRCDTTATNGDIQIVPVGTSEPRSHPGWDDWSNIRYRASLSKDAKGGSEGHTGDLTYDSLVTSATRQAALLDPDLVAAKTVDKADAAPGDKLTYRVTARNAGTGDAASVKVTDTLPDGTVQERTPPTIYAGAAPTETFTYNVPCDTADGTVLRNTVRLTARNLQSGAERNTANNSASASTTIHAPVMTLDKTATATAGAGEAITYRLTYANTGGGDARSVVITDTLPADTYYSTALDLGAGRKPSSVTLNSDGTRTLTWTIGDVAAASDPGVIEFTARPTLLSLGGTQYVNQASLRFTDANGCTHAPVTASASTAITVTPATRNPLTIGYWRTHPAHWTAETLARIQATDQRYDGADASMPNGEITALEVTAALAPASAPHVILRQQLLATYFNLAERRINAATAISSKLATRLQLKTVRDAALYGIATLALAPKTNRDRYSDAIIVLDEINRNVSEVYGP